ncbi:MAG: TRAP transporter substrate-binding protein [Deltaproteobacteria bacterium]|nr:TRAP transporter substrate-binding protein [Deltaproteobacteria bacterium]MBW1954293.1 TRAP transporter substrate-binding protein [Deltaproteobacteria bacterium]MBW2040821.1 TRAP transporter substrate-binding protein [Deltaproteobacteria bacterium]MBW2132377.1 TRAP transporter substrate-binding protein [Deltaproteobacteria bacterium]
MKTRGITGIIVAVCLMAGFIPAQAADNPVKLSYANFPPAPTFPCVQMERWKTEVEKRTNGKVSIDTYPGGTLLNAKNMMDGVIAGQANIGNLCMAYQPGRFVVTNATSLPLGIPNARVGSLVLWDLWEKYQPEEFSKVKVLAMFTTAPNNIMSKVPVRRLEDMKGLDLRASGGAAQVLSAWGANPVGMPMPQTVEALQKGVVKGLFSSLEVMKDFKFAETCKYITVVDTVIYPFAVVMNMETWKSLPPDVQKVMDDLRVEQSEWTGNYMDNHVKESVEWSQKEQNVEVITLSSEEKARWDAKLGFLTEKWIADATQKGLPAKAIVDDIRTLIKKHNK